ncbi:type II toxin-antitoxin system HicA family toxin [Roseateles terrae]|uniref:mRNA interferase HicA n=1 Tax=Roseateles terrae TaxID=431060 RepID=A0ABR6GQF9_9BURK|nr:type II toxin-antitoxin system HicA family toxin [Roseateles terrae]MBB3193917.1 mRNA interferase HicA [Roseateles terrae]OWQ87796.1 mRNA interferase [Roseateles terrae]
MKISEFKRWLESQGVVVTQGTRHWKLKKGDRAAVLPRHPGKELKTGTQKAIVKQLGL